MKYEIKNRFTGEVQFTAEIDASEDSGPSLKMGLAVRWATKHDANLIDANLMGANLRGADLRGADFRGANLMGANLMGANLTGADFRGAKLIDAKLRDADFRGADLRGADLRDANFRGAKLIDAKLRDANLIDGGQDVRGYRFVGWKKNGEVRILAGCQDLTLDKAISHWGADNYQGPKTNINRVLLIKCIAQEKGWTE